MPDQAPRTCLAQIQHMRKTSGVAVVGVGHFGFTQPLGKGQEQSQFACVLWRANALQFGQIASVHWQNQVKLLEI